MTTKRPKPQKYRLVNGEEITEHDAIEFSDILLDMVNNNSCVTFEWMGEIDEDGILTVEVS